MLFLFGRSRRGDPTRTGDRLVPNQERYQLRYTPKGGLRGCFPKSGAKVRHFADMGKEKAEKIQFDAIFL